MTLVIVPVVCDDVWQERERFRNPHKAFTYRMHGYEAVVGPVKGVLARENAMKPREHALLIKDRPSYVTILTLGRTYRSTVAWLYIHCIICTC